MEFSGDNNVSRFVATYDSDIFTTGYADNNGNKELYINESNFVGLWCFYTKHTLVCF